MVNLKFDVSKIKPPEFYRYASYGIENNMLIIRYALSSKKDGYSKFMYQIYNEQQKLKTYKSEAAVTKFLNKRNIDA